MIEAIIYYSEDSVVYLIPESLQYKFEGTDYYDREKFFAKYIIPQGATLGGIYIEERSLDRLVEGELEW